MQDCRAGMALVTTWHEPRANEGNILDLFRSAAAQEQDRAISLQQSLVADVARRFRARTKACNVAVLSRRRCESFRLFVDRPTALQPILLSSSPPDETQCLRPSAHFLGNEQAQTLAVPVDATIFFGPSTSTFGNIVRGCPVIAFRFQTTPPPRRRTIRAAPCTDVNRTDCRLAPGPQPTCLSPERRRITNG